MKKPPRSHPIMLRASTADLVAIAAIAPGDTQAAAIRRALAAYPIPDATRRTLEDAATAVRRFQRLLYWVHRPERTPEAATQAFAFARAEQALLSGGKP